MNAREWYAELDHLPAGRVWAAVRRVRREQPWPSLAVLLDAARTEARDEAARRPALSAPEARGEPITPEQRAKLQALGLLSAGRRVPAGDQSGPAFEAERRQLDALAHMAPPSRNGAQPTTEETP